MEDRDFEQHKAIAAHGAYAAGFIAARMEVDKSILGLAAGGIALVVTLMTNSAATSCTLVLNMLAVAAFLGAISTVLVVLWQGGDQLAAAAIGIRVPNNVALDYTARALFIVGVVLTCIAGGLSGFHRLKQEELKMTQKVMTTDFQRSLTGVDVFMPKIPAASLTAPAPTSQTADSPPLLPPAPATTAAPSK